MQTYPKLVSAFPSNARLSSVTYSTIKTFNGNNSHPITSPPDRRCSETHYTQGSRKWRCIRWRLRRIGRMARGIRILIFGWRGRTRNKLRVQGGSPRILILMRMVGLLLIVSTCWTRMLGRTRYFQKGRNKQKKMTQKCSKTVIGRIQRVHFTYGIRSIKMRISTAAVMVVLPSDLHI